MYVYINSRASTSVGNSSRMWGCWWRSGRYRCGNGRFVWNLGDIPFSLPKIKKLILFSNKWIIYGIQTWFSGLTSQKSSDSKGSLTWRGECYGIQMRFQWRKHIDQHMDVINSDTHLWNKCHMTIKYMSRDYHMIIIIYPMIKTAIS